MVITGYRIASTDLTAVTDEMRKVQSKVKRISEREYGLLLAEKAAFLCDCTALNMCERVPGHAIIDDAVTQLNDEITIAMHTGAAVPQNLQVYVHLSPYEGDTYVRVTSPNTKFLKAFGGLEPFSLTEDESSNSQNRKTQVWLAVCEASKHAEPASINLTHIPQAVPERLKFPSIGDRAEKMARHNMLNQYINMLSGGRQIPPVYMMEYVDRALELLLSDDGKRELRLKVLQLANMLPDLNENKDIVLLPYGSAPPKQSFAETGDTVTKEGVQKDNESDNSDSKGQKSQT